MRRARLGAVIGALVATIVLVGTLADCHEPTEIEIDVRTDSCAVVKNAGIAVGTRDTVETEDLTAYSTRGAGCQPPGDRLGTLVIYPSGAKDAEVAVRIVVGVTRSAQECKKGDYDGCIVARRYLAFKPGESQKVVVIMQGKCVSQDCGPGAECKSGSCFVELEDGGVLEAGPIEGGPTDGSSTDAPADAPADASVDTGVDACAACPSNNCTGTQCNVDCSKINCNTGPTPVCGPGLDCVLSCDAGGCTNVACASQGLCRFDCWVASACANVACRADRCYVNCATGSSCTGGTINLSGADAGIQCTGSGACTNDATYCDAGHCDLECKSSSSGSVNCPTTSGCSAGTNCIGPW